MEGIGCVSFDVGGTLIGPWPSVGEVYAEVAARNGFPGVDGAELTARFGRVWKACEGFDYSREAWCQVVEATFSGWVEAEACRNFFPELYERFAEPGAWRIYPDVRPALEGLRTRGYRLAIVSNWDERLRPLLRGLELDGYFEELVISCEAGFTKPRREVFDLLLAKLRLSAEAVMHVGDSARMDVEGARGAGLHAVRLVRGRAAGAGEVGELGDLRL